MGDVAVVSGKRGRTYPSPDIRLWTRVEKTETCWLWTGHKVSGYAMLSVSGKSTYAHRFAYELLVGPIPEGLQLDHLCRVRHCVNPAHLEPVTPRENVARGVSPAAVRKIVCKRGHPLTEGPNLYLSPTGVRVCRTCRRMGTHTEEFRAKHAAYMREWNKKKRGS